MSKLFKIKLMLNKANKSANLSVPKKLLDKSMRDKVKGARYAFVKFEDFE
jgi:hypothetical protein